jgi:predicted dehydrogenase
MKVRVGVIGCGRAAQRIHLNTLTNLQEAEIAAVCDVDGELARIVGGKYKVGRIYSDHRDLVLDKDLDCVLICTPPETHKQIALDAARANKHIFIEKPLARTVEEAEIIVEECRAKKVKLMVGLMRRFDRALKWAKHEVDEGKLGEIFALNSFYYHTTMYPEYLKKTDVGVVSSLVPPASPKTEIDLSGFLANHLIHHADLLRWFGGPVSQVFASYERKSWFNITAVVKFAGSSCTGTFQFAGPVRKDWEEMLVAHGTQGSLTVRMFFPYLDSPSTATFVSDQQGVKQSPLTLVNCMYQDEIRHFLNSVATDQKPSPSGLDAIEAQRLLTALERSLSEKTWAVM